MPNEHLYFCYAYPTSPNNTIRCDKINSTGAHTFGPDPGGSDIIGAPSIAFFDGTLYMVYRKSTSRIWWRKLIGSAGSRTWSAETDTGLSSTVDPVLASSREDYAFPVNNDLFLVYVASGTRKLSYNRFNLGTGSWGLPWTAGQGDEQFTPETNARPAAAMFRGRLHVAVTGMPSWFSGADTRVYSFSCAAPCETTAPAPTCDLPENAQQWTRFVEQDGLSGGGLHLDDIAAQDSRLYLWHTFFAVLIQRSKHSM
jgi:hypothetical protein